MTIDRQKLIWEEESFTESFTEPQSNGSPLNFEAILEKNKKNYELAEEQYRKEQYKTERLLFNEW